MFLLTVFGTLLALCNLPKGSLVSIWQESGSGLIKLGINLQLSNKERVTDQERSDRRHAGSQLLQHLFSAIGSKPERTRVDFFRQDGEHFQ